MTSFGLCRQRHAMAAAGQETGGEGESGPARPSLGRIRGPDADSHAVGAADVAGRRQMPWPIRRDCPLRANEQVVYTAYTRANFSGC